MPAELNNPKQRPERNKTHYCFGAIICFAVILYAAWLVRLYLRDPSFVFLCDDGEAHWISFDEPVNLRVQNSGILNRAFRVRFITQAETDGAKLRLKVLKRWNVRLDGKLIAGADSDFAHWKKEYLVPFGPLSPGEHELKIYAQNDTGAVAMRASSDELGIWSNDRWEGSVDDKNWTKVRLASKRPPSLLSRQFESIPAAFATTSPWLLAIFGLTVTLSLGGSYLSCLRSRWITSPTTVRWFVITAWVSLGAHNILRLPNASGFDITGHLEYIDYLLSHKRLPLATDGWQMFQSPFYYFIAAPTAFVLEKFTSVVRTVFFLRGISLAAGIVQIEICYRALRLIFPLRRDLQIIGVIFAGSLPMNVYISQYIGNEPLASCFGAVVLFLCMKYLVGYNPDHNKHRDLIVIGVVLGVALLTKFSAAILVAIILGLFVYQLVRQWGIGPNARKNSAIQCFLVLGVAGLICGWYYVRNWISLGKPFVGGWEIRAGVSWWQDPGYRMMGDLFRFGEALRHPVYSSIVGFWDGVYATFWCDGLISSAIEYPFRPPWNYPFLLTSVWLALLPLCAIIVGIMRTFLGPFAATVPVIRFPVACIFVYLAALLHHFLTVPYYCTVKSFYMLSALPCYTIVAVVGFDYFMRNVVLRAIALGIFACWVVSVYAAYWSQ